MNFVVSSKYLFQQLSMIHGVVPSSSTIPIQLDFLFIAQNNVLHVTATDGETTISTILQEVQIKEEGSVAIPAKMLMETLKTFADVPLTFIIDARWNITLASDRGKYKLAGHDPSEYTRIPEMEETGSFTIEAITLSTAISKTVFAVANDDLRPVMNGVLFQMGADGINFVATDAHKLVKYRRLDVSAQQPGEVIVPKKPLNVLRGMLGNNEFPVQVQFSQKLVRFTFQNIELFSRLIDGKYPNYEVVIPKVNPNKLVVDKVAFQNAIRRVMIFSNKSTFQVRLRLTGSELYISAEDLDFNNEAMEQLTARYEGDDMEIGFNSRFLSEMLGNIDGEHISLELSEANRPGILAPVDYQRDIEEIIMLVMPITLGS